MKFLQRISINFRLTLFISSIIFAIFILLILFLYRFEVEKQGVELKTQMDKELSSLTTTYDIVKSNNLKQLNISITSIKSIFNDQIQIQENDTSIITIEALNQITETRQKIHLKKWLVNNRSIYNDNWLVEKLIKMEDTYSSIFQKVPEGFVLICSNLKDKAGSFQSEFLIPNSANISSAIEKGLDFKCSLLINGVFYISVFEPIFKDGKVIGMFALYLNEFQDPTIKNNFLKLNKSKINSAFIINKAGDYLIQTGQEIQNKLDPFLLDQFKPVGGFAKYFEYEISEFGIKKHSFIFYTYHKESDVYFCLNINKAEINERLDSYLWFLIKLFILIFIVSFVVLYLAFLPILVKVNKIMNLIRGLSSGKKVSKLELEGVNEISILIRDINKIIETKNATIQLAREISKDNLDFKTPSIVIEDVLGQTLLEMRTEMFENKLKYEVRQKNEDLQKWASDGVSLFNDLLRVHSTNLVELSQNVLKKLIEYTGSTQGAFFLKQNMINEQATFKMYASYAYNKTRNDDKEIAWGDGLVGRAVLEKKMIYISDIPDGYLTITSGLGEKTPRYLVIMPLLINDDPIGAIEMASFNEFPLYKQDFIKQITRMVSVSTNTVVVNHQTSILLKQSQIQSEELANKEVVMRRNFEELQTAQKIAISKEIEQKGVLEALYQSTYLIEFDMDGCVIKLNQNSIELLKLKPDALIGINHKLISSLFTDLDNYDLHWSKLKKNIVCKCQETITLPDQRFFKFKTTYTPIMDLNQNPYKVLCIYYLEP